MEILKTNQKGVTLIVLVITIILMITLAAVTIEVGTGSIDNSKLLSFLSYMQTIQSKVNLISEYENYSDYGAILSDSNKSELQTILNSDHESFSTTIDSSYLRFFDSSHIASDLGVDNIDDKIVVDFNTREVISLNGIKYEGEMYYTQYNLPGGQTLTQQTEDINRIISFGDIISNIDGLNSTFTIEDINIGNGTLSYGKMDESREIKWVTVTNYTKNGDGTLTITKKENNTTVKYLLDAKGKQKLIGDGKTQSEIANDLRKQIDEKKYNIYLTSIYDKDQKFVFADDIINKTFGLYNIKNNKYKKLFSYKADATSLYTSIAKITNENNLNYYQVSCSGYNC